MLPERKQGILTKATLRFCVLDCDFEFVMLTDSNNLSDQDMLAPFVNKMVPETDVLECIVRLLRPGDYVVDGGANIGFHTLLMSQLVGPTGHVTAFEPDARNIEKLRANLQLNNCTNVTVIEQPLWAERINKNFNLCDHNSWGTFLAAPYGNAPVQNIVMLTATLNEVPGPLRYIKLDVEGAELPALCGASNHIIKTPKQCPYITCELNKVMLQQLQLDQHVLNNMMRAHGYKVFLLRAGAPPLYIPAGARATTLDANESMVLNLLFSTDA